MFIEVKIGELQWALYCSLVVTGAAAAAAPRVHCRSCRTFYDVSEQLQRRNQEISPRQDRALTVDNVHAVSVDMDSEMLI